MDTQMDAARDASSPAADNAEMLAFIDESRSMFHTVAALRERLDAAGFTYLPEGSAWEVAPGGRYYTQRNGSSLVAWRVGSLLDSYHFQLTASHADSPTFKVKAAPELDAAGGARRLNVEAYGGMIDYSWFDRPLGLAGRVMVREGSRVESRLLSIDRPVALIPSLAIHQNRDVNKGFAPNRQVDLCPLFSAGDPAARSLDELVAAELGVEPSQVMARDLYLASLERGCVWGDAGEFVSAPRIDDLMCAFASLKAFLASDNPHDVSVYCCFDNEEVGSGTKQGAMSTLLRDCLERLNAALGRTDEDLRRAIAGSMLVSCDNAHAVHPNQPGRSDDANRCVLNGGLVIKEAANQAYCTDAFSRAVFAAILDEAGAPRQTFANRSDVVGGSTLGNLSNMQVSMHAVDVGCAQLAMHSAFETAGARDLGHAVRALTAFYDADIHVEAADAAEF